MDKIPPTIARKMIFACMLILHWVEVYVTSDPTVLSVAQKYNKDTDQIELWHLLQVGYGVTFLSTLESRLI